MATEIPQLPVYLGEWLDFLNVSDETLATGLGVVRETVWKWKDKGYLRTDKLAEIAAVLGRKPMELLSPPSRPSVDAKLADASDDMHRRIASIVDTLLSSEH